jgi:Kef-type K+ transport system membrane component KefB
MFVTGTELRTPPLASQRQASLAVAFAGVALPLSAGILTFALLHPPGLEGSAHSTAALGIVFAAALALTSIPVISRIMMDLGLLSTSFARIVLGAAVIEDVVLFGLLGIAVGLSESAAETTGLAALVGVTPDSPIGAAYYGLAVLGVLAVAFLVSRYADSPRSALAALCDSLAFQVVFLLASIVLMFLISAPPLFGGLTAGLIVGRCGRAGATQQMKAIGLALFIPVYFALVGFRLDLQVVDLGFFVAFFCFACATKAGSVYLGARFARIAPARAWDLAVALNARGGPGIVLATVGLEAGIIDESFYASLILLAILSSLIAGWWLERRVALLVDEPVPAGRQPAPTARAATQPIAG